MGDKITLIRRVGSTGTAGRKDQVSILKLAVFADKAATILTRTGVVWKWVDI